MIDRFYLDLMARFEKKYELIHANIVVAARAGNLDQVAKFASQLEGLDAAVGIVEALAKDKELV